MGMNGGNKKINDYFIAVEHRCCLYHLYSPLIVGQQSFHNFHTFLKMALTMDQYQARLITLLTDGDFHTDFNGNAI
eukprot:SAG22_NODE_2195_length_2853_cov_3.813362_2_plen_76_part_00